MSACFRILTGGKAAQTRLCQEEKPTKLTIKEAIV